MTIGVRVKSTDGERGSMAAFIEVLSSKLFSNRSVFISPIAGELFLFKQVDI